MIANATQRKPGHKGGTFNRCTCGHRKFRHVQHPEVHSPVYQECMDCPCKRYKKAIITQSSLE